MGWSSCLPSEKCRLAISRFPALRCLSFSPCLSLSLPVSTMATVVFVCLYGREPIINTVGTMANNGQHNRAFVLPRVPPDRCQMYMHMYFRYPRTSGAAPVSLCACLPALQLTPVPSRLCARGRFSSPKDIIPYTSPDTSPGAIPPGSNSARLSREQAQGHPTQGKRYNNNDSEQ